MDAVGAVRLAALGIGFVGALAAGVGVVRSRGDRTLAPLALLLGVAGLAVSAALAVLLPPIAFKAPVLWALVGGGAVVGILAGMTVRVRGAPGVVFVRGGTWHLLPAALALVGLQLAGLADSLDAVVLATAAVVGCVAFAVGAVALVVLRESATRLRPVVATAPAVAAAVASAAGTSPPATRPTVAPSATAAWPVSAPRPRPATSVRMACSACGSPVRAGWRHCVTCGAALAWE